LALVCGRNATAEAKIPFFFFASFSPSRLKNPVYREAAVLIFKLFEVGILGSR